MKVALATCEEKLNLTAGDRSLVVSLEKLGVQASAVVWTNPTSLDEAWDGVIIRSVWDYHQNSQRFLQWAKDASQVSKLINSFDVIAWNLNKSYLLKMIENGIACPPSLIIQRDVPPEEALDKIKSQGCSHIVVKPTVSATAFLTSRCFVKDKELLGKIREIQSHSEVLIQPYIKSIETEGELSLVFFNGKSIDYSHAVLKKPGPGDYRVQIDFGGSEVATTPSREIVSFASSALTKIDGDWTFARVDIIDWKNSPLVSEIELIEPDLFLTHDPNASSRFAQAIVTKLQSATV